MSMSKVVRYRTWWPRAADDHVGRADPFQGAQDVNEETEVELAVVRHGRSPLVF